MISPHLFDVFAGSLSWWSQARGSDLAKKRDSATALMEGITGRFYRRCLHQFPSFKMVGLTMKNGRYGSGKS
jgi:hypothetical protein